VLPIALMSLLLLVALGWTAAWYVLAGQIEAEADRWLAREAAAGRVHDCAERRIGGFPFRLEIICRGFSSASGQGAEAIAIKAAGLHVVAQVYNPGHVIAEIESPVEIDSPALPGRVTATFELAQASYRGSLDAMERTALVVDKLAVEQAGSVPMNWTSSHVELHARRPPMAAPEARDFDVAFSAHDLSVEGATTPIDLDVQGKVAALPERWRGPHASLREWQARGGSLEISALRAEADRVLASARGVLSLDDQGRLDGKLAAEIAGVEALAAQLPRSGSGYGAMLGPTAALLGGTARLEGRPAVKLELAMRGGDVRLGPIPLGRVPPLYPPAQ